MRLNRNYIILGFIAIISTIIASSLVIRHSRYKLNPADDDTISYIKLRSKSDGNNQKYKYLYTLTNVKSQGINAKNINVIAEEFIQDGTPFPKGFKSLKELNDQFLSENITENSTKIANNLRNVLLQVNYLGPEAKSNGVECRQNICRVVSSFSESASVVNVNIAMRQLQRINPESFKNAGIDRPISITTRVSKMLNGPSFLAFYAM